MSKIVLIIFFGSLAGCASASLSSGANPRMPASSHGLNWLVRTCRSTSNGSIQSVQYVESSSNVASTTQLQNSKLAVELVATPLNLPSDTAVGGTCTCDSIAIQSGEKIYVDQTLRDLLTEGDRKRLMNDIALGAGVEPSDVNKWCGAKFKLFDR